MALDPWYKIAVPRREVREGRSFNPDEFAIHLEQVVSGKAPEDYRNPEHFFARTCFTRALREHAGMVLRRIAGQTANTAPVMTLVTQFGGGKTHTLAALYHLAENGKKAQSFAGVDDLVLQAGLGEVPRARVAAFVGNAWDPQDGSETPWIDIARRLAGDKGVKELGPAARTTPPGTEALGRVFAAADAPVLLLFDEVLNYLNRHRGMADQFHAFIQNLTVAMTATTHGAAVISLPRSQVEMTDWDVEWQDKITKVVRRVAKDLIANDEAEISEVVRRRLFEDVGDDRVRMQVAKSYADWCFERRSELPPEWTAVDSASTEAKTREYLQQRFATCYPFHPATLSVFQRKWQALRQYQQTRGTLAMLAQWIAWVYSSDHREARKELLISLGSAPLHAPDFRSVVLGQLGESRLAAAIDADITGSHSHADALDADTKGALSKIHRRVATAIFFESSGGQIDKVAHQPELRFALGGPDVDTTSVDNAAYALEQRSYFIRKIGTDAYKIGFQPTVKKVVNDRRASLDEDTEILPTMRQLVQQEFERGTSIGLVPFPADGAAVQDSPKLTLALVDPTYEWTGSGPLRTQLSDWTKQRGKSPRLYPGSIVWCLKKPGRDFREKVELMLAWRRVLREVSDGTLGGEFDKGDLAEIRSRAVEAEQAAKDDVWGGYRYAVIYDSTEPHGLRAIDLGAGHSSARETLCGRVLAALKSEELLNESVGVGYLERNWPPAFKVSGSWPLSSLRQSFLNGSLTRLPDPDAILRAKIVEFVASGGFGLASEQLPEGTYKQVWFEEQIDPAEVSFEPKVFLLQKARAAALRSGTEADHGKPTFPAPTPTVSPEPTGPTLEPEREPTPATKARTIRLIGDIPPEVWNRLGTKVLPKLRSGADLRVGVDFSVTVDGDVASNLIADLRLALDELGLSGKVRVD